MSSLSPEDRLPIASKVYTLPLMIYSFPIILGFKRCHKCSMRHYQARSYPTLCTSSAPNCVYRVDTDFGFPCNACLGNSSPESCRPLILTVTNPL